MTNFLYSGTPFERPPWWEATPLERPLDYYGNLNIHVLISTPEERPLRLKGHFSGAKEVDSQEGFNCIGKSIVVFHRFWPCLWRRAPAWWPRGRPGSGPWWWRTEAGGPRAPSPLSPSLSAALRFHPTSHPLASVCFPLRKKHGKIMKVPVDIYLKSINSFHKLYEADICTYQNAYNTHAYLPLSLRMYETVIVWK